MGYGFGGGFGGGNMQALMRQAQKMQEDMKRTREEIDASEYASSVGGGMVEVTLYGNRTVKSVKIKPEVVDPEDIEMLEDLVASAVGDALKKIADDEKAKLPNLGM
ncbi:MAG: YbaB/EbfC family nucleoid-associated protein [Candidatus Caccovivens sp.]